jgi:hypothetical protein
MSMNWNFKAEIVLNDLGKEVVAAFYKIVRPADAFGDDVYNYAWRRLAKKYPILKGFVDVGEADAIPFRYYAGKRTTHELTNQGAVWKIDCDLNSHYARTLSDAFVEIVIPLIAAKATCVRVYEETPGREEVWEYIDGKQSDSGWMDKLNRGYDPY